MGLDADIVALIQAGEPTDEISSLWRQQCPGYDVSLADAGIVCLTRATSRDARVIPSTTRRSSAMST